jgi:hypothetical protein
MEEVKKGNLTLCMKQLKKVGDVAVGLCFDLKVSGCCLARLQSGHNCECTGPGTAEACLAYGLYASVRKALCGDPKAVMASKVSDVYCGAHNGQVFFSWTTQGTVSAVRKSLGMALGALRPDSLWAPWAKCMKYIDPEGGAPKRPVYNWVAQKAIDGIAKGVHCVAVGKVTLTGKYTDKKTGAKKVRTAEETIKNTLATLEKKLPVRTIKGKKASPAEGKSCGMDGVTKVAVKGWHASLLQDYIMAKAPGSNPVIVDGGVLIPVDPKVWATASGKLLKTLDTTVKGRYAPLGAFLGDFLAYRAIGSASASGCDVKTLLNKGTTPAEVKAALKKLL